MRPVAVVGIGKTAFGAFPDRDLRSLAVEAGQKALENGHANAVSSRGVLSRQFRRAVVCRTESSGAVHCRRDGDQGRTGTRFEAACASSGSAFFHAVSAVAAGLVRHRAGGGRGEDDFAADAQGDRNSGGRGRSVRRSARGRDVPGAVRDDRAAPYVSVRNHARANGGGGGEEPSERREESAGAHAQGDHHGAGAGGQADRRAAHGLRLLADQRRRGRGADHAARSRAGVHGQAGAGAGRRADIG